MLESIHRLTMTVRPIAEGADYNAAAEPIRAELGIGVHAMRGQLRGSFALMGKIRARAQVGLLLRLYEAARADMPEAA